MDNATEECKQGEHFKTRIKGEVINKTVNKSTECVYHIKAIYTRPQTEINVCLVGNLNVNAVLLQGSFTAFESHKH